MKSISSLHSDQIAIRTAYPDDEATLRSLAQLDSATVPAEPVLVAEVEGEIHAALSLSDGTVVADPFVPTDQLVVLLEVHAAQLGEPRWGIASRRRSAARAAAAVWRGLAPREREPFPVHPARTNPRDAALASSPRAWLRAS